MPRSKRRKKTQTADLPARKVTRLSDRMLSIFGFFSSLISFIGAGAALVWPNSPLLGWGLMLGGFAALGVFLAVLWIELVNPINGSNARQWPPFARAAIWIGVLTLAVLASEAFYFLRPFLK